jgi:hypothetical protein
MSKNIDHISAFNEAPMHYTASQSPYLQGTEIVTVGQLLNSTQVKIRGNISIATSLNGVGLGYQNTNGRYRFFDDSISPENFGNLVVNSVDVYTPGRVDGPTGKNTYITFLKSGSHVPVPDGSSRSSANLTSQGRLNYYISHQIEQRDLGQSNVYEDNSPFYEPDPVSKNPSIFLTSEPENIVVPVSLVLAGTPSSYDGVIEAMTIRSIVDRTSIELPFVSKGIKGSLSVVDDLQRSYIVEDSIDIRQVSQNLGTTPFLDYVSTFGPIDQPGALSDSKETLSPFVDTSCIESSYAQGIVDDEMRHMFFSGITSSSQKYLPPDINFFPIYTVAARHGFIFSQNDNFRYDSIAFGGLKR